MGFKTGDVVRTSGGIGFVLGMLILLLLTVPWVAQGNGAWEISKHAPAVAEAGGVLTYTITVTNTTGAVVSDRWVLDSVPWHSTYVRGSMSAQPGVLTATEPVSVEPGSAMTWTLGSLADGASISMTFSVLVDTPLFSGTQITNTAWVDGVFDTAKTTIQGHPDLTVTKTVTPSVVYPGQVVTYTLLLTNLGNAVASDVTVTDTLPTGFVPKRTVWHIQDLVNSMTLTLVTKAPLEKGLYMNVVTVTYGAETRTTGPTAPVEVAPRRIFLPLVQRNHFVPLPAWHQGGATSGLTVYHVAACAADCNRLYAATRDQGVYVSGDGGQTWAPSGLPGATVNWVVVRPGDCTTAYAATWGSGVQKTVNGGLTWAPANTGLADFYLYALAIAPDGQTLYAGTASHGVFKSVNGGASWAAANSGPLSSALVDALLLEPGNPQVVYAATWGSGVFKSQNGGGTWTAINTGLQDSQIYSLALDPADPQILYAGGFEKGVFRSSNGGGLWVQEGLVDKSVYTVVVDGSGQALAGTDGTVGGQGVYVRGSAGVWEPFALQPGSSPVVRSLTACDPDIHAGTADGAWWYGISR